MFGPVIYDRTAYFDVPYTYSSIVENDTRTAIPRVEPHLTSLAGLVEYMGSRCYFQRVRAQQSRY